MKIPSKSEPDLLERFVTYLETQNGQRVGICAFSIVAVIVLMALPGGALAYVFGIPFMFFIPGFAVVKMFFWKGTTQEAKFVLSVGISVLVVILLGLILVLTPIGLDSTTTRASLIIFALAAVAIETFWLHSDRGTSGEQQVTRRSVKKIRADKVVVAMLATALVVSAISLGLIVTAKYPSRTYFALTDEDGKIISNASWVVGTNLTLLLHMKNGESGTRNFTILAYGVSKGWIETDYYATHTYGRVLQKGQVWNQTVSFNLINAGCFSRLDFDLYIQMGLEPPYLYGNLHLWVRVLLLSEASSVNGSSIASSPSPFIDRIAVSRTATIADERALAMLIATVPMMSSTRRLVSKFNVSSWPNRKNRPERESQSAMMMPKATPIAAPASAFSNACGNTRFLMADRDAPMVFSTPSLLRPALTSCEKTDVTASDASRAEMAPMVNNATATLP
jgi:uncharacterized membrane protein